MQKVILASVLLWCSCAVAQTDAALPAQEVPPAPHIKAGIQAGHLIQKRSPIYPPEAKAKGISGTVAIHAVIGKDGVVRDLKVISGPPELADAAVDAVQDWRYAPYTLNGEPTEVTTTIRVNFHLGDGSPAAQPEPRDLARLPEGGIVGGMPAPTGDFKPNCDLPVPDHPVRISSGVMKGLLIQRTAPIYPSDAKAKGMSGVVSLHAVIGKDGVVKDLSVVSGPSELQDAAMDAVKTWRYKPYVLNCKHMEVETMILVSFDLYPAGL